MYVFDCLCMHLLVCTQIHATIGETTVTEGHPTFVARPKSHAARCIGGVQVIIDLQSSAFSGGQRPSPAQYRIRYAPRSRRLSMLHNRCGSMVSSKVAREKLRNAKVDGCYFTVAHVVPLLHVGATVPQVGEEFPFLFTSLTPAQVVVGPQFPCANFLVNQQGYGRLMAMFPIGRPLAMVSSVHRWRTHRLLMVNNGSCWFAMVMVTNTRAEELN